jgi:hypothetical protein
LQLKRAVALKHLRLIDDQIGQHFRVGYYTPNDGLETIWIVDERGRYIGTIERRRLRSYFRIRKLSKEFDYCGVKSVGPLQEHQRLETGRTR